MGKLGKAIEQGAILSEPSKAPDALQRFLESRAVRKYEKQMQAVADAFESEPPKSVQVKQEREKLKIGPEPSRW